MEEPQLPRAFVFDDVNEDELAVVAHAWRLRKTGRRGYGDYPDLAALLGALRSWCETHRITPRQIATSISGRYTISERHIRNMLNPAFKSELRALSAWAMTCARRLPYAIRVGFAVFAFERAGV
jgi:hypothetical protein